MVPVGLLKIDLWPFRSKSFCPDFLSSPTEEPTRQWKIFCRIIEAAAPCCTPLRDSGREKRTGKNGRLALSKRKRYGRIFTRTAILPRKQQESLREYQEDHQNASSFIRDLNHPATPKHLILKQIYVCECVFLVAHCLFRYSFSSLCV